MKQFFLFCHFPTTVSECVHNYNLIRPFLRPGINPIGNWAVNKRELHVLTSRLRKVDPAYYKPVNEQIDLEQLFSIILCHLTVAISL